MEKILAVPEDNIFDVLTNVILKNNLLSELTLTEVETVTKNNDIVYKHFIEGSVSFDKTADVSNLKEEIEELSRNNPKLNSKEIFKVSLGYSVGDKIKSLDLKDNNSNILNLNFIQNNNNNKSIDDTNLTNNFKIKNLNVNKNSKCIKKLNLLYLWSVYNKKFNTELQFIELKNIIKENKLEDNVSQFMVCGDLNYEKFKSFITSKSWDLFLEQYYNSEVFFDLNITDSPTLLILDGEGTIKFRGSPYSLDIIKTIKNLINNSDSDIIRETNIDKKDNLWWNELDEYGKKEIVEEITNSLFDVDLVNLQFAVVSQKVFFNNNVNYYIIPLITGSINSNTAEDKQLSQFIKDIDETLSFKNVQVDVSYSNEINTVSNFEIIASEDNIEIIDKVFADLNINKQ